MKQLIINADDFGFTPDVNAGIIYAHTHGILTSTTLMANGSAFDDAVRLARETPALDVGCHLVLVQGRSLVTGRPLPEKPAQLLTALFQRKFDIYAELRAQIEKIISAGISPTHLDTHKHTHLVPQVFRTLVRLAREFSIPFVRLPLDKTAPVVRLPSTIGEGYFRRIAREYNVQMTDHFLGFRLTGSFTEATFLKSIQSLPEGTTEFMCHPGYLGPELKCAATRLKESRVLELEALTSERVRRLLDESGVRLGPFRSSRQETG